MPEPVPLTPLLERLLLQIAKTCQPRAADWAEQMRRKLWEELYSLARPGDEIRADDFNAFHWRLLAVEQRLSASEPSVRLNVEYPSRPEFVHTKELT